MRFTKLSFIGLILASVSAPISAQAVLDRVDPTRAEDRAMETASDEDETGAPRIDYTPLSEFDEPDLTVGAIDISGLQAMARADFADIVEKYIGRPLSGPELTELVERLAARARTQYPLASAYIEPQSVRAGVLRVHIDEGRIDAVRLKGDQNAAVIAALEPLVSGNPVTTRELEKRVLIAGDIDGVLLGDARIAREGDLNVLVVEADRRRAEGQLTLDNDSTRPSGPLELYGNARINGVLNSDDSFQMFALATVPEVEELDYVRLRYADRIAPSGTEIIALGSYSRSRPGAYLADLNIEGQSWLASLGFLHPLHRSRRSSLWIDGALAHREVMQERAGIMVRQDRLTTATAGVYGFSRLAGGRLRVNVTVTQGIDVGNATEKGDPLSSREDADGAFTSVLLSAGWKTTIIGDFGLDIATRTQLASQPLLISEEIGLGGANFLRGYDYRERSGDQGTMAYGEINYEWDRDIGPLDSVEIYGFADGGRVTNFGNDFGSGALFSAGAGLRADFDGRVNAGLEVAAPLSGERFETEDRSVNVRFSLSRKF